MATKEIRVSGIIGWDTTPGGVKEQLDAANGGPVHFTFASPGGFVSPGLEIFNMIRNYAGPVSGTLSGTCASMCSYIPMAIPLNYKSPGKLKAEDNAIFMIHNAWGYAAGDHNEMLKRHNTLKGMSGILNKAYAKRTGKAGEEISAMMDVETYLYGEEILDAGFVDEIVAGVEEDDGKDVAMITARAAVEDVQGRMSADQASVKADFAKMLAFIDTTGATQAHAITPPASAGKNNTEVQQMKLTELLAANPTARAEHEAAITAAKADGVKAGKGEVEARITAVAPFLASTDYPPTVGAVALKVLNGTASEDTLTAVVAAVDATKEQQQAAAATTGTKTVGETPGQQVTAVDPAAVVTDEAGLSAAIARHKGGA